MKILVTGGTGFVGTLPRQPAVAARATPSPSSRGDPRKTRNRYNRPVEAVPGDVLDPASLERAAAGPRRRRPPGRHHPREGRADLRPHAPRGRRRTSWRRRRAAGVRRFLHMSAMGSERGLALRVRAHQGGGREGRARVAASTGRSSGRRSSSGRATASCRLLAPIVRRQPGVHSGHRRRARLAFSRSPSRTSPASSRTRSRSPRPSGRRYRGRRTRSLHVRTTSTARSRRPSASPASRSSTCRSGTAACSRAVFEWLARRGVLADPPLTRDQLRRASSRDNVGDVSATVAAFRRRLEALRSRDPRLPLERPPRSPLGFGDDVELERRSVIRIR